MKNKKEKMIMNHFFQFDPKDSIRIPLTVANVEDTIKFFIKTISPLKADSQVYTLTSVDIPYVVTIDAQDLQNPGYTPYE